MSAPTTDSLDRDRRISYASVPFNRSRIAALLTAPLALVSNIAVVATVYLPWRTARVHWKPSLEDVIRAGAINGKPVIFYSWHAYEPFLMVAFREVSERLMPHAIGHDGLASRAIQHAVAWFGIPVWVYRRRSPVSPVQQIIKLVREGGRPVALIADAGGPYGRVKRGMAEIARAADAPLLPIVVRARRRLRIPLPWGYGIPLPFCSIDAYAGELLEGSTATPEKCQQALEALEARVDSKTV